jgi:predicted nucleic acid-binding protein
LSVAGVFHLLERAIVVVSFDLQAEHLAVGALMDKYSQLPMDLADACLVRMAETHSRATVMTIDSDFMIYRQNTRQVIPTIMPPEVRNRAMRKRKG